MSMFGRIGFSSVVGRIGSSTSSINFASNNLQSIRFATKKAGGSTKNGRDSAGRRLGVKKFGGERVEPGYIIIRQRGQKYHNGANTYMSKDHTIHADIEGWVQFTYNRLKKHQIVSVVTENPFPRTVSTPVLQDAAVAH